MATNLERIQKVVARQFGIESDPTLIDPMKHFDDFGGDSLDRVEVIIYIELEFKIKIDDFEASEILNIQDALDYIEGKRKYK